MTGTSASRRLLRPGASHNGRLRFIKSYFRDSTGPPPPPKVENLCKRVKIKQQFLNKYVWSFTLDSGEGMKT